MLRGILISWCLASITAFQAPKISPATGLPNQFYTWKEDQQIRYQCSGQGPPVLLVHGLFVNSDHWRKTLKELEGYRVYALDLWGCGYSHKPPADTVQHLNGEIGRPKVLNNVALGSANGATERIQDVDLLHPLKSPYNFYTWANLLNDFSREVVQKENGPQPITLVANSIGTISALQAVWDERDIYNGVFVVCPNFRELHSAEIPLSSISMPIVRQVQRLLRQYGQVAFDALAKPETVKQILKEPYAVTEAVDDTLVQVLLDPLLTPGASDVVFDTLSYSAGPLPEPLLADFPQPVWVCYGTADPWTPGPRVEALRKLAAVERVEALEGIGHCPHDEAPELVHPLLLEFLERLKVDE